MSNYLYANHLTDGMEDASPRMKYLVLFSVSITFADGRYTIAASRDDCNGVHERHVDSYRRGARTLIGASQSPGWPLLPLTTYRPLERPIEPERGIEMIITNRSHVQFRGVTCTCEFNYYATATCAVVCRVAQCIAPGLHR